MRLLLDTHVFLWYISGDSRLPPRLRDVVRDENGVEIGAMNYNQNVTYDGKPGVMAAVFALPGTNAIQAVDGVKKLMEVSQLELLGLRLTPIM